MAAAASVLRSGPYRGRLGTWCKDVITFTGIDGTDGDQNVSISLGAFPSPVKRGGIFINRTSTLGGGSPAVAFKLDPEECTVGDAKIGSVTTQVATGRTLAPFETTADKAPIVFPDGIWKAQLAVSGTTSDTTGTYSATVTIVTELSS